MDKKTLLLGEDEKSIQTAAQILRNGGLCAIPTETVYGLAANALDGKAVDSIFAAKGRPRDNPLIVHISDISSLDMLVSEVPEKAKLLAEKFWPGPLTMIMPKSEIIPDEVSAGLDTVAVRFPSHKTAQRIISCAGVPLAAPSANLSGSPSPTTARHVFEDMNGRIDAIVDGGNCSVGVESTVITLATEKPRLLRPGGITVEMIESVIGKIDVDHAVTEKMNEGERAASPGMKYKHYAPKANVIIVDADDDKYAEFVNARKQIGVFALCFEEDCGKLSVPCVTFGKENDYNAQAAELFSALRELDEKNAKTVYARCPSKDGVALAVYNRLLRAAGFEVVKP